MKLFSLIILSVFHSNFLIIPLWDIRESSIDLLQPDVRSGFSNRITIFNETKENTTVIFTKKS